MASPPQATSAPKGGSPAEHNPCCPRSPKMAYSASMKHPSVPCVFQMPLHYPRFAESEYQSMPEWQLDRLLEEYGLPMPASLPEKRNLAIGTFLWRTSS